jgi:hypothetical protein
LTQGRGRDASVLCGAAEAAVSRNGDERIEIGEIDGLHCSKSRAARGAPPK